MSIVKKTNPNDLTEDEIQYLRGNHVAPEIKLFLSRQHENLGVSTSALQKVARNARAKCDALLAVRELSELNDELTRLATARQTISVLERKVSALEGQLDGKDANIRKLTAAPALAVHSED